MEDGVTHIKAQARLLPKVNEVFRSQQEKHMILKYNCTEMPDRNAA
jgi:hypothetical protein